MAAGDGRLGGIIGVDGVVTWYDLDEPRGGQDRRSAMQVYDAEFSFRLRVLAAAAVSLLPGWARRPLYLPRLPVTETVLVRPAGHVMVHAIQWAITGPQPAPAA